MRARRSRTRGVCGKDTGEVRHGLDESADCVLISYFNLGDDRGEEGRQGTRLRRGLGGGAIRVQSKERHFVHVLEIITVRNVTKIPLFSPNFFLTLITYGLLSYSVRLYCANIHTPLPFSFLSSQFSDHEDKASRFILSGKSRTTVLQVLVVIIFRTWLCTLFPQARSLCSVRGLNYVQTS